MPKLPSASPSPKYAKLMRAAELLYVASYQIVSSGKASHTDQYLVTPMWDEFNVGKPVNALEDSVYEVMKVSFDELKSISKAALDFYLVPLTCARVNNVSLTEADTQWVLRDSFLKTKEKSRLLQLFPQTR